MAFGSSITFLFFFNFISIINGSPIKKHFHELKQNLCVSHNDRKTKQRTLLKFQGIPMCVKFDINWFSRFKASFKAIFKWTLIYI